MLSVLDYSICARRARHRNGHDISDFDKVSKSEYEHV